MTYSAPAGHEVGNKAPREKQTAVSLRQRKGDKNGKRIVVITAYDVAFARLAEAAGADIVLVGDSLGMVVQGHSSTLPVTLDDMIYHARAVARGLRSAHLLVDMPFMSYQASVEDGMRAAGRLLKEANAEAVKIEGGVEVAPLIARLVSVGIPVMGHVGLKPQSVHQVGGFKVQGRTADQSAAILEDARAVVAAGAYALLVESVPRSLAAAITADVAVPTIGIGAGPDCDGQVLVMHDLLGMTPGWKPRFVRQYVNLAEVVTDAFSAFAADVRESRFPKDDESYSG